MKTLKNHWEKMGVRVNVHSSKIMRTSIVETYKHVKPHYPAVIYLLKVNNKNIKIKKLKMLKVNTKDTTTTLMASFWFLCC